MESCYCKLSHSFIGVFCSLCTELITSLEDELSEDEPDIIGQANKLCDKITNKNSILDPLCKVSRIKRAFPQLTFKYFSKSVTPKSKKLLMISRIRRNPRQFARRSNSAPNNQSNFTYLSFVACIYANSTVSQ